MSTKAIIPSNVFSAIALILLLWTALNWLTMIFPAVFFPNNTSDYPVLFQPFVGIDQLFPNPDNDMDGPFVIGTVFLPLVAAVFALIGHFVTMRQKKEDKASKNILTASLVIAGLLIIMMLVGGFMNLLNPSPVLPY